MSHGKEDSALLNRIWSQTLFEELTRFGVKHVCVAPGSRSTPLTLEADANEKLTLHTHFDERGLGFLALGMAKAGNEPVAIVVTSGTAVANLLPAIAESGLTGEKLVVLTADRPVELIGCGANQAINQVNIFGTHVTDALNLPEPTTRIPLNWLLSSLDDCMYKQQEQGGAIHINCPFPEPLYTNADKSVYDTYIQSVSDWAVATAPYTEKPVVIRPTVADYANLSNKRGLVVIGNVSSEDAEAAKNYAEALGWPLFCDPQSGVSSDWAHYDIWLQNESARARLSECDLIVQFGARLVSKRLDALINQLVTSKGTEYRLITAENKRLNPNHLKQQIFNVNPSDWVVAQNNVDVDSVYSGWADSLTEYSKQVARLTENEELLTELSLACQFDSLIKTELIFIGNSLIVRLLDMVGSLNGKQVFTNRGASGIDGLVATAVGVQRVTEQPLTLILGDTSLLYDLNSLALASNAKQPMVIVVINNDGGAIFDLLPVPPKQREALYQMPHGFEFEHAAKQFQLNYCNPDSLDALRSIVNEHLGNAKGTLLVEVKTPAEQASSDIKSLVSKIQAI